MGPRLEKAWHSARDNNSHDSTGAPQRHRARSALEGSCSSTSHWGDEHIRHGPVESGWIVQRDLPPQSPLASLQIKMIDLGKRKRFTLHEQRTIVDSPLHGILAACEAINRSHRARP